MILNFSWCLSPAVSCAVLNKGPVAPEAGLPSPYRKHPLNWGPAATAACLPSPSSLRDATSPKVRGLGSPQSFQFGIFTPCCRKGSRQALRSDFPPLPRAPPLGKTPSGRREMSHVRQREDSWREAPERASPAARTLRLCLALRAVRQRGRGCLRRDFASV